MAKTSLNKEVANKSDTASRKKRKAKAEASDFLEKYKKHTKDTGSLEVQIIILTKNIASLTEHLKVHKKDFDSKRGLLKMVARRRRLLTALKTTNPEVYAKMIADLGLRK